jgi:putative NIF3 family GTP cyclohydrolase 1 type 2
MGTYKGNEHSNPVIGERLELVQADEIKIEVTFEKHLESKILKALFQTHIYEEVAYEIYDLKNQHQNIGLGMIGELATPMNEKEFLEMVQEKMQTGGIRHSQYLNKSIQKVAVLGGAGSFAIKNAIRAGADAFLTADLKYHQFYEAENQLLLADIGHFESERYTKNYIVDFLRKKILNFAIIFSEENTNPVKYL